jgi:hypothetical protein
VAPEDFKFASAVASFGMILRGSKYAGDADCEAKSLLRDRRLVGCFVGYTCWAFCRLYLLGVLSAMLMRAVDMGRDAVGYTAAKLLVGQRHFRYFALQNASWPAVLAIATVLLRKPRLSPKRLGEVALSNWIR